jgi:hypothetical protein
MDPRLFDDVPDVIFFDEICRDERHPGYRGAFCKTRDGELIVMLEDLSQYEEVG